MDKELQGKACFTVLFLRVKIEIDLNISEFNNACVLSKLPYACECWTLIEHDEASLNVFDMRCQRSILRVIWSQHITNSSMRSRTKQPQLTAVIRKHRL